MRSQDTRLGHRLFNGNHTGNDFGQFSGDDLKTHESYV